MEIEKAVENVGRKELEKDKILKIISDVVEKEKINAYLVGGSVRDFFIGRKEKKDYDIVIEGKRIKEIVQKIKDQIGGKIVLINPFLIRLIIQKNNQTKELDFNNLIGKNILEDLKRRDFTINAIAYHLNGKKFIDPVEGIKDIKNKTIKFIEEGVILEDPIRLLRAIRFAAELNFKLHRKTAPLIKKYRHLIKEAAYERIINELTIILSVKEAHKYITTLNELLMLEELFPELKVIIQDKMLWQHSINTLRWVEYISYHLEYFFPQFFKNIEKELRKPLKGLSKNILIGLKLGALFHDIGKPATRRWLHDKNGKLRLRFINHDKIGKEIFYELAKRIKLANKEKEFIGALIQHHMWPGYLSVVEHLTERAILRFFRKLKDIAVPSIILSLADWYATEQITPQALYKHHQTMCKLFARLYKEEEVLPKRLLNGYQIMSYFNLPTSPLIGELLKQLELAQIDGKVKTTEEALSFLKNYLDAKYGHR